MKKQILFATVFGVTLGLAGSAFAQPGGGMPERPNAQRGGERGSPMAAMLKQLDLSDEQKALAKELRTEMRSTQTEQRAVRAELGQAMMSELASGTPNAKQLHKLVDQRAELESQAAHARMDAMMELMSSLSDEQRTKRSERAGERVERAQERGARSTGAAE